MWCCCVRSSAANKGRPTSSDLTAIKIIWYENTGSVTYCWDTNLNLIWSKQPFPFPIATPRSAEDEDNGVLAGVSLAGCSCLEGRPAVPSLSPSLATELEAEAMRNLEKEAHCLMILFSNILFRRKEAHLIFPNQSKMSSNIELLLNEREFLDEEAKKRCDEGIQQLKRKQQQQWPRSEECVRGTSETNPMLDTYYW